ncbi:MAG: hypothetical protein DI569_01320 [Sphingopyxis macrogoltabida]|uniref:ER-bound oxygenase mpaB/mpaB'/Rubber oxygenase catalytic domain-containing protein n=1 Tax=Sphingopyxis macrogoltabida TaxID=33050 RepID=A0A2W5NDV7_SPHMC|nr:MAG: hypothetical protein DI569_01320 [Sphingopyxis macrogoltabida]
MTYQAGPMSFERLTTGRHVRNVAATRAKYGDAPVDKFLTDLTRGDDVAQAVIGDIAKLKGQGWAMVDEALEKGIDQVPDAPPSMVAMFREAEHVPDWVDYDQLRRGSIAYWRAGPILSFVLLVSALGSSLTYRSTRPLVFTGRLEEKTPTRARETSRWLLSATKPDEMRKGRHGYKLTVKLRLIHAAVSVACKNSKRWNWDDWGYPICHADNMNAIGYVFTQTMIDPLIRSGYKVSKQEREDIYALFRYIGYLLGVPDDVNIIDEDDSRARNEIYYELTPGPDEPCRVMLEGLLATVNGSGEDNVDALPWIVRKTMPPERLRMLMIGMMRYWCGDKVADGFDLPQSHWRYALPMLKPFIKLSELKRSVFGADDEKAALKTIATLEANLARDDESELVPVEDIKPTRRYADGPRAVDAVAAD